jgi:formylglycine-generating enzyme required for sulfatase activity
VILSELIAEDPQYRDYLKRVVQKALNHQLTQAFLMERYEHYLTTATQLQVPSLDYLPRLRQFLERRRDFFRLTSEQWLNSPPSQRVVVTAPPNVDVVIEGERVRTGYEGLYFPDIELTADVAEEHRQGFTGWQVNGQLRPATSPLKFKADRETRIEAVFNNKVTSPAEAATMATPPVSPATSAPGVWRTIPAGESWMGCVPADDRCDEAENPRVRQTFSRPFEMLDREVSADDFRAFAAAAPSRCHGSLNGTRTAPTPSSTSPGDEAAAYCEWVKGRLPTEAEWEHAARGGLDGKLFPWGDEFTGQANGRHNIKTEQFNFTSPVASFPPNAFGLYDMAGNVWEWTASAFTLTHAAAPATDRYDLRTIKGGGWDNLIRVCGCRNARRYPGRAAIICTSVFGAFDEANPPPADCRCHRGCRALAESRVIRRGGHDGCDGPCRDDPVASGTGRSADSDVDHRGGYGIVASARRNVLGTGNGFQRCRCSPSRCSSFPTCRGSLTGCRRSGCSPGQVESSSGLSSLVRCCGSCFLDLRGESACPRLSSAARAAPFSSASCLSL